MTKIIDNNIRKYKLKKSLGQTEPEITGTEALIKVIIG